MAATNYTPIQLYFSTTASAAPTAANLAQGELAINITDGKLYYEDNAGAVQVIATKGAGTIGGSTTQIQYNNAGALAGNAAMVFNNSTNVTTLTTLNLTNALGAIYGGTAQSAYTQGDILYSSATNTLSKLGIGTVNYILTSSGSIPQWVAPSSIAVLTATNLAGGLAGSVPYQSALDTTTFLAIGTANRVMTSSGTAPQWVTSLTGLTGVSSSSITDTGLTSGRVTFASTSGLLADSSSLTFNGTTLTTAGLSNSGLSTLVKTLTLGDTSFNGAAVFAPATPAKLYMGTGTVTDVTSAISATNTTGAIASLAITPIAATNTGVTYTNASTLYIAGAPSAGTNVTITNPYSLYVAAGASYLASLTLGAALPVGSGGTGLGGATPFTSSGVVYASSSSALATGSALTFDGTNFATTGSVTGATLKSIRASGSQPEVVIQQTGVASWSIYNPPSSTDLRFYNGSDLLTLNSTSLYTASGINVGIGTSSPAYKLDVRVAPASGGAAGAGVTTGSYEGTILITGSAYNNYGVGANTAWLYSATNDVAIGPYGGSGTVQIVTGGARRATIDASGNLGIGTSSPVEKVQSSKGIAATGANQSVGSLNGFVADYSSGASRIFASRNGVASSTLELWTTDSGGAANKNATLDSSGNLGLGVTPSAWRTLYGQKSIQFGPVGFVYSLSAASNNNQTVFGSNWYLNTSSSPTYINSDYATSYIQTNGQHQWLIAPSGTAGTAISFTQAMTLDASGNLIVGNTTPFLSAANRGNISINGASSSILAMGVGAVNATYLYCSSNDADFWNPLNGFIRFGTNNTERARIDSSGNLLVGTTTFQGRFTVTATGSTTIDCERTETSNANQILFRNGNGVVGSITTNGSVTSYNVTSDQRLKENIVDAPDFGSVIDSLQVRSFNWKADQTHQRAGFIAQELLTTVPEAVSQPEDTEQMMAVDYSKLVPMLVKEIQSLRQRLSAANL